MSDVWRSVLRVIFCGITVDYSGKVIFVITPYYTKITEEGGSPTYLNPIDAENHKNEHDKKNS